MPIINDPDGLSQGGSTTPGDVAFTTSAGANTTMTGAASLPAVTAGDYLELRNMVNAGNNGLFIVTGVPTTSSIDLTKQSISGAVVNPSNETANATAVILGTNANEKNIYIDAPNRAFTFLNGFGSTTVLDDEGVIGQFLYSFFKEEWKNDNYLIRFPFPMTAITPEQFEFNGWVPVDEVDSTIATTNPSNTRQLIRTAGWSEVSAAGFITKSGFGLVTLGNVDSTDKVTGDRPYYFFGSQAAAASTVFAGPANEFVETITGTDLTGAGTIAFATTSTFTRTIGSFLTDGYLVGDYLFIQNAEDAANNGAFLITAVVALTITVTGTPFTINADDTTALAAIDRRQVAFTSRIRVFGKTYDQSTSNEIGVATLVNQVYRFPLSEGPDAPIVDLANTETAGNIATLLTNISGTPIAPYNDMAIGYFAADQTRSGFVAVGGDTPSPGDAQFGAIIEGDAGGAAGGPPSAEQIYAFVQATLQETGNINDPDARITGEAAITIAGQLAEPLVALASTGNTMSTLLQTTAIGGATSLGVAIDNFDTNDTNRLAFAETAVDTRTFPFVAAGSILFNPNLSTDVDAVYRMFFTNDDAGDNTGRDFGTVGALTVQDNAGPVDIAGAVPQNVVGSSVAFDFDYDGNIQRGAASAGADAPITIVAIGLGTGQYVVATGTITRNVGQTFSLVAALERNFSNPV